MIDRLRAEAAAERNEINLSVKRTNYKQKKKRNKKVSF